MSECFTPSHRQQLTINNWQLTINNIKKCDLVVGGKIRLVADRRPKKPGFLKKPGFWWEQKIGFFVQFKKPGFLNNTFAKLIKKPGFLPTGFLEPVFLDNLRNPVFYQPGFWWE